jgi:MSHA biogenesis protein MshO
MRRDQRRQRRRSAGFSLIELIVVILLTAIVAGAVGNFVVAPMQGYSDLNRRAMLIDVAQSSLRRMARDVRRAVPNTVRISGDTRSLEFLHTLDGGRYRADPGTNAGPPVEDHTAATDTLEFTGDTQFNVLGRLNGDNFTYGNPMTAGTRLTVYPISTTIYSHAANGTNPGLITPSGTTLTITDDTDEDHIALSASHQFSFSSPRGRFYITDTPVSYLCDLAANTLTRYATYSIAASQPTDPSVAPLNGGTSALVANRVTECAFTYEPGTSQRAGLMTLKLTIAESGEQVRLLHQVHVSNVP